MTGDGFLDGRIRIRQRERGYRAGLDSMLLAAAIAPKPGGRALEAGCGAGAALIAAAWRNPEAAFLGIEREPEDAALARGNVAANALEGRVTVIEGDLFDLPAGLGAFACVFANPPFAEENEGQAPAPGRRHAHVTEASLDRWVGALANLLVGGGDLVMIHRAEKLAELLAALKGRLGGAQILPVRPHPSAAAKRVLARARKGSRAPLTLLAGLDLHETPGGPLTPAAEAILRGEAAIAWPEG